MPPVISGREAAHAAAAARAAKKFMYPQHTDADGPAQSPPVRPDVHHRGAWVPGGAGAVHVQCDRLAGGWVGRFDHHRDAGHRGDAQGVDRAHGKDGRVAGYLHPVRGRQRGERVGHGDLPGVIEAQEVRVGELT